MDLREARFKERISQWELSKRARVHQSRISLIENGHRAKEDEKRRIAKVLGVPVGMIWPTQREDNK